jgi:8-oxo-dGTP diphosphatase
MAVDPEVVVPSIRLILTDAQGQVLLLRRANSRYGEGAWCLPGGKIDYGETVEAAAARELTEETSMQLACCRFLFYQDSLATSAGGMHCINLYFECQASGEVQLNDESDSFAWVSRDQLSGYEIVFRNDDALRLYWSQ